MDTKHYKINDEGDYLNSVSKVKIPWLEHSLDVWVDLDYKQQWFTAIQVTALDNVIGLPGSYITHLRSKIEKCYFKELEQNKILKKEYTDILETINWQETQICIPKHEKSQNRYVLLLPETDWEIVDSDFTLELEVLFTNEKIEICQEMSGLWCSPEWLEYYVKR